MQKQPAKLKKLLLKKQRKLPKRLKLQPLLKAKQALNNQPLCFIARIYENPAIAPGFLFAHSDTYETYPRTKNACDNAPTISKTVQDVNEYWAMKKFFAA
ncbi:hypothetical protein GCM10007879_10690 [Maritalea porphyrae]|uniref:Uncharacterized protein n=1 Tax=Maritalea porphyrae TaxID=880732 RepID=A0ABQ5UR59_9HYPH|nr:hypothetical protein GCM10007879_10690 [Maritalea porphyrae]